jgi:hypothetical protein
LLVGVFATAYKYHGATIDAYLHTSHLHVQEWLLLIFGSLFVGSVAYSFLKVPDIQSGLRRPYPRCFETGGFSAS